MSETPAQPHSSNQALQTLRVSRLFACGSNLRGVPKQFCFRSNRLPCCFTCATPQEEAAPKQKTQQIVAYGTLPGAVPNFELTAASYSFYDVADMMEEL